MARVLDLGAFGRGTYSQIRTAFGNFLLSAHDHFGNFFVHAAIHSTGGYLVLYWLLILLGQCEVIKSGIFPGGAIRPLETKLASDGATRCNYVIRKRLEQLVL